MTYFKRGTPKQVTLGKFSTYLTFCRAPVLRKFLLKKLARSYMISLSLDSKNTIHCLLAELGCSKEPAFTHLVVEMIEAMPEEIMESSKLLADHFNTPGDRPIKERIRLCRTNLMGCFNIRALRPKGQKTIYYYLAHIS